MLFYHHTDTPPLITKLETPFISHTHQHEHPELCYVLSGCIQYTVGSDSYTLRPGNMILVFPYCLHSIRSVPDEVRPPHLLLMTPGLTFLPDFEKRFCEYTMPHVLYRPKELDASTRHALCELESCVDTDGMFYPHTHTVDTLRAKGWLTVILGDLFYKHSVTVRREKLEPTLIRSLVTYSRKHLSDEPDWNTICRELGISLHYLTHTLKQLIYVNHSSMLTLLRLEEADRLLCQSSMPLADIALACGFDSPDAMRNAYKKTTGITPAAMRKLCDHPCQDPPVRSDAQSGTASLT